MARAPCGRSEDRTRENAEGGLTATTATTSRGSIRKGAWTAEEDAKLVAFIKKNKGHGSWRTLPKLAGLERCGKSCRLRWTNYLRPNIKRGNFSEDEERTILELHAVVGNKWSSIASHLPGRTDNEVKNHWNTHLKKRLAKMGIDPTTHLPLNFFLLHHHNYNNLSSDQPYRQHLMANSEWQRALLQQSLQLDPSLFSHLIQWELARLEAEARQQFVNTHGTYLQNYYASCLQNAQQNQAQANTLNDFLGASSNLELHGANMPLPNSFNVLQEGKHDILNPQPHSSNFLKDLYPSLHQGDDLSPNQLNSTTIDTLDTAYAPLDNEGVGGEILNGYAHTNTTNSIATPDTSSSSDTFSSQLIPNECVNLEDFGIDLSSDEINNMPITNSGRHIIDRSSDEINNMPTTNSGTHDTDLSVNNHSSLYDSYWSTILNLLGQVPSETF